MKNIFASTIIALIVSLLAVFAFQNRSAEISKTESAYERVVRTGTIRCGYVSWFPYFRKDLKTGELSGMNYEIMSAVGKELNLKVEWTEEVGWGNLGEGLKTGRYDAVCTSVGPDAAKTKNFTLSKPMLYSQFYPYVRADDNRFDGHLERINQPDVRIVAIDGALTYNLARDNFPNAQIIALPPMVGDAEVLLTVTSGKADIINIDSVEIRPFMENNPGKLRRVENVPPVRVLPHVMMFAPNEEKLAAKIDFVLQSLTDNGVTARILAKYSPDYLVPAPGYVKP